MRNKQWLNVTKYKFEVFVLYLRISELCHFILLLHCTSPLYLSDSLSYLSFFRLQFSIHFKKNRHLQRWFWMCEKRKGFRFPYGWENPPPWLAGKCIDTKFQTGFFFLNSWKSWLLWIHSRPRCVMLHTYESLIENDGFIDQTTLIAI